MGCTASKDTKKVAPTQKIEQIPAEKKQETVQKRSIDKQPLPAIKKPVAFDILLDEQDNKEPTTGKLVLPKLAPIKKLTENEQELLKQRIREKEQQAEMNRRAEKAKQLEKIAQQELKSRKVQEKKKQIESELQDSACGLSQDLELE